MNLNVFGQRVRIELVMFIMLIGGFIGVTFWCNCKGNIYEGLSDLGFSDLDDDEPGRINCGCVNKNDRLTIGNAPRGSEFSM